MLAKRLYWMAFIVVLYLGIVSMAFGQTTPDSSQEKKAEASRAEEATPQSQPPAPTDEPRVERREVIVPAGTRVPLTVLNYVSSRNARAGDPIYLETMFPITVGGHVVIPVGSYVRGTITEVTRSGKVKNRAEMYVRFDSITLPNGTNRDFNATLTQADARIPGNMKEGKIEAEGTRGRDAATIAGTAAAGTSIGAIAGGASGHGGTGAAIGAGAGALTGLIIALTQRGHEIDLYRGTEVDMTLDRNLVFDESELARSARDPASDRYFDRPGPPPRNKTTDPRIQDRYGRRFPIPF
jgi:type IV secretion system protein VirB10